MKSEATRSKLEGQKEFVMEMIGHLEFTAAEWQALTLTAKLHKAAGQRTFCTMAAMKCWRGFRTAQAEP